MCVHTNATATPSPGWCCTCARECRYQPLRAAANRLSASHNQRARSHYPTNDDVMLRTRLPHPTLQESESGAMYTPQQQCRLPTALPSAPLLFLAMFSFSQFCALLLAFICQHKQNFPPKSSFDRKFFSKKIIFSLSYHLRVHIFDMVAYFFASSRATATASSPDTIGNLSLRNVH